MRRLWATTTGPTSTWTPGGRTSLSIPGHMRLEALMRLIWTKWRGTTTLTAMGSTTWTTSVLPCPIRPRPTLTPMAWETHASPWLRRAISISPRYPGHKGPLGATVTVPVTLTNTYPLAATGVRVALRIPAGLAFAAATATRGTLSGPTWTVSSLPARTSATLTIKLESSLPGARALVAEITAADQRDPSSTRTTTPLGRTTRPGHWLPACPWPVLRPS